MIDNYKFLLRTIICQDNEETKSVICVYDTKDFDKLIAIFGRSKYCAYLFKTTAKVIDCSVCKKELKNGRYRLERVKL